MKLDGRVVDEHPVLLELLFGRPASDGEEHGVELLVRAVLDADLAAFGSERTPVAAREGEEVANELGRGGGRRRLDADRADWRLLSGGA